MSTEHSLRSRSANYLKVALRAAIFTSFLGQAARGEEVLNRRAEARGAFMARPAGVFRQTCAHCHGEDGRGGGRLWAMDLEPRPPDLTRTPLDEGALVEFLTKGSARSGRSNLCPPWDRTLSPEDLRRLARHLASLAGKAPPPPRGSEERAAPGDGPSPRLLLSVLLAEAIVLWRLLSRRKEVSHVVPEDPSLRR